jgi:hypothetical protein
MDLEGQLKDTITVDEYAAKMGEDKDIITITFTTNSKLAAEDLVTWFELGYKFVLDASVSDGEIEPGQWLVFVEIKRRSKAPEQIISLLTDLETLTGYKLKDWNIIIDDEEYDADEHLLHQTMILNPNEYKKDDEVEEELNEFRTIAGLDVESVYEDDGLIQNMKEIAGI